MYYVKNSIIQMSHTIDSPRSKLQGIIDPVKDLYIYLPANPAAKLRETEFTGPAKPTDSAKRKQR